MLHCLSNTLTQIRKCGKIGYTVKENIMTVKTRLPKIKQASKNVIRTLKASSSKSSYDVISLSNPAVHYQMKTEYASKLRVEDIEYSMFYVTCQKVTGHGMEDCKGNNNGAVCYHSLAAIMKRANESGKKLVLVDTFLDAVRLLSFGGQMVKVEGQGTGAVWGTVR